MIDFHTHILPGVDDGSPDQSVTKAMLYEESMQGVELIVATPHFYADRMSIGAFLENRSRALAQAEEIRREAECAGEYLPALIPASEVYYFRGIGRAEAVLDLCIEGTHALLLEMPFEQWTEENFRDVRDLVHRQKLTVILAHIERYVGFQKDPEIWDRVLELPLYTQINTGSFLRRDRFLRPDRRKRFCFRWIEEHPFFLLGSDCHNMRDRRPNLAAGRTAIAARLGDSVLARSDAAAEEILGTRV